MSQHPRQLPPAAGTVPRNRGFFGHPLGLMTLFTTELWERFSYYGMRAILLYYLTDAVAEGGLGIGETTGLAIVSIYGSSVYLLAVVGGWLADRILGARRSTLYGGVVIAAGHICLSIPGAQFSYVGIVLVALGTGLLKPNVSAMVGELYSREDGRRDSGFSVAAVGMALALVFFVAGRRLLGAAGAGAPNPLTPADRPGLVRSGGMIGGLIVVILLGARLISGSFGVSTLIDTLSILAFAAPVAYFVVMIRSPKVTTPERSRLKAYIPLFIAATLFWMIFEQAATTLASFAANRTDLSVFGTDIAPELFQSVNPASIILLAPVFAWLWIKLDNPPPTAVKFAIGLTLAASSFLFLSAASYAAGADGKTPAWVLVIVYVVQTLGELCLSPVGLAATTLLAPRAFRSQAMALWFLAPAAGQAITAQLVTATEGATDTVYFGVIGVVALVFAVALFAVAPWVERHIVAGAETSAEAAEAAGEAADGVDVQPVR